MAGRSRYDNPFEEGGADEVNPFAVSPALTGRRWAPAPLPPLSFLPPLLQLRLIACSAAQFVWSASSAAEFWSQLESRFLRSYILYAKFSCDEIKNIRSFS
jgi:hypothetical protein